LEKKRLEVFFEGSVQGVGFRYTVQRLSNRYPVTGYVRNLSSGEVELVAEGEGKSVEAFLKAVSETFKSYIRRTNPYWKKATGEFENFGIRF
jgi:acylphosphatase